MNEVFGPLLAILCGVAVAFFAGWGLTSILRRYLDVSQGKAVLILLLSLIAGVGADLIRLQQQEVPTPFRRWDHQDLKPLSDLCAGLLAAVLMIFVAKLHAKWIAGGATDAEKKPGMDGVRAWLGAGNVLCVALLSLLAWLAFDYSPCGVALLGLLALLAYPGMNFAAIYFQAPPAAESNAPERQRVLNMLDSGKITASECAELLSALNISDKPRATKAAAGPPRKLALIGAVLLLVGFFLPWFSFNPQSEMNRVAQSLPIDPDWTQRFLSNAITLDTIRISGGDIAHGLGWLVLALGVAAAVFPYFAGHLPEQTRQRAILAALGLGAIILVYLVTQNLRFVSISIFLAVLGYGLQLAGALRDGHFSGHGTD